MRKYYLFVAFFILSIIAGSHSYAQPSVLWTARFNGLLDSVDVAKSIAVDNAGNVYVTGYSQYLAGLLTDIITIKYDGITGAEIWRARYGGLLWDEGNKIIIDNSNRYIYVTGFSYGLLTLADYITIKYDAMTGDSIWARRYDRSLLFDEAKSIAVDGNGNVYVTGYTTTLLTLKDYTTIKYNSSGVLQWVTNYNGPANSDDIAYSLALDRNSNVFVTGSSRASFLLPGTEDYLTVKYDSNGVPLWTSRYNGPGNSEDIAYAIVVDNSDNAIVTGSSRSGPLTGSEDYETIKYTNGGAQSWERRYNGTGNGEDRAYAIVVDNSDNVIVTGESNGSGSGQDYTTVKYSSAGTQQWASRYNGTGNSEDRAYAIVVDNSDNVYVTGESDRSGSGLDYATINYSPTGTQQWAVFYNGPGNNEDRAYAIVVDNSDNVIVTGSSRHGSVLGTEDYLTIKYGNPNLVEINSNQKPSRFSLSQNYPNPFNPVTYIRFDVAYQSKVYLSLFNVLGKEVSVLVDRKLSPGTYEVSWNSEGFTSGVYFYRISMGDFTDTKKMILVK